MIEHLSQTLPAWTDINSTVFDPVAEPGGSPDVDLSSYRVADRDFDTAKAACRVRSRAGE
ncbi:MULTISPECIES: hypothetical protein [unclassified Kitasatospora]|uniref:hypothetical protein n=1 Tax=unclassified Kitasatospora TaxID=2633591 RepID=UPI0012FB5D72|nr:MULTISPECIES: hypothetical protein [unclassified Kitasatospora]